MEKVSISEFRANLLKYLAKAKRGTELTITSNGDVLATVIAPVDKAATARKRLKEISKTAVLGDLITPVDEEWNALR